MRLLLLVVGLMLALMATPEARMHAPYRGHRIIPAGAAPLDSFTTPAGAYSFRKLRRAYSGPAIRIRRASDNAELDINFLGFVAGLGAPWDEAAANTFCAATTCFGRWWYDQSGVARDIGNATAANQPALVFACKGTLPCWDFTAVTQTLTSSGNFTPATGVLTLSIVANRVSGTATCNFFRQTGTTNRLVSQNAADQWLLQATGSMVAAAVNNAWHAGIGVINGASSVMAIDGVEITGSITGSTTPGLTSTLGQTGQSCRIAEAIHWDAYAMPAGERAAWRANQQSFWGTP